MNGESRSNKMSCVALSQTGGGLRAHGLADSTILLGLFQSVYLNRAMLCEYTHTRTHTKQPRGASTFTADWLEICLTGNLAWGKTQTEMRDENISLKVRGNLNAYEHKCAYESADEQKFPHPHSAKIAQPTSLQGQSSHEQTAPPHPPLVNV